MNNLEKLCGLPGVSGDEKEVRDFLINEYKSRGLSLKEDRLGSVFGIKEGSSDLTVMVSSNLDESGMMVSFVREDGLIDFISIGLNEKSAYNQLEVVLLSRRHEKTLGIVVNVDGNYYVDAGFKSDKEAEKAGVLVGNFITVKPKFRTLENNLILSNNLSNRAGINFGLDLLDSVKDKSLDYNLAVGGISLSVVGQRGAITATTVVEPDLALVIDVAYVKDAKDNEIHIRNFDKTLLPSQLLKNTLYDTCESMGLTPRAHMTDAGSDGSFVHKSLSGTPTIVLVIPVKHEKGIYNVLDLNHSKTLLEFVSQFLEKLTKADIKTMQYDRGNRYE